MDTTSTGSKVIGYNTQFLITVSNNLKETINVYNESFDQVIVFDRKEHYCAPQNVSILNW